MKVEYWYGCYWLCFPISWHPNLNFEAFDKVHLLSNVGIFAKRINVLFSESLFCLLLVFSLLLIDKIFLLPCLVLEFLFCLNQNHLSLTVKSNKKTTKSLSDRTSYSLLTPWRVLHVIYSFYLSLRDLVFTVYHVISFNYCLGLFRIRLTIWMFTHLLSLT